MLLMLLLWVSCLSSGCSRARCCNAADQVRQEVQEVSRRWCSLEPVKLAAVWRKMNTVIPAGTSGAPHQAAGFTSINHANENQWLRNRKPVGFQTRRGRRGGRAFRWLMDEEREACEGSGTATENAPTLGDLPQHIMYLTANKSGGAAAGTRKRLVIL